MTGTGTRPRRATAATVALLVAVASASAGCGGGGNGPRGDDDLPYEGERVTVFGPEVEDEQRTLRQAFAPLEEQTGLTVQVTGHRDFEQRIDSMVAGGNPPDIAIFPQPGKVLDIADDVVALPGPIARTTLANFDPEWTDLVTRDTEVLAVPVKADLKSVVWYDPQAFTRHGYRVPETFEDFLALAERMAAEGNTPFCLGMESEFATGWPFTDWVEDFLLRLAGPDTYDAWYRHTIPFDDPQVVEAASFTYEFLARDGYVHEGLERAAARPANLAGGPLLQGDCMMYKMPNFYTPNWPEDIELGPDGDVDAFFLPGSAAYPDIALTGGSYAAAFNDDPAVMATMEYLATVTFAEQRAATTTGGFLSPSNSIDASSYASPLDRRFAKRLADAGPIRFDASDLMPGAVGSGSLWRASVAISTGDRTVADAFAAIERDWPPG
jgi:alpha-glucoside transport system substrate-binding protein